MQPLRVAALMDTSIISGPGRQLVAVADELRHHQVELLIITFRRRGKAASPFPAYARERGIRCEEVDESSRLDRRILTSVSRLIREHGAHVLQSHSYKPAAVAALVRRTVGLPWIGMFHGTTLEDRRVRLYNWIDRRLLRLADRIVVVSPSQETMFGRSPKVQVIPNAVLEPMSQEFADARVTAAPRPRIAVIGRLSHEKGVDVFLDALAVLRQRGFAGSALIVGDGPDRVPLEEKAKALGLTGGLDFLGHRSDVDAIYPHLDLVVIPSRSEGMPNVLLEAIRADRPVVATSVGAIPSMIRATSAALLVPPAQPALLAAAIVTGLDELQSSEARSARAGVAREYSLDRRARLFRSLYEDVVQSHPSMPHEAMAMSAGTDG
jgi:glycosyltransferase involved in cell wall biosynthesis